jgi:hypothetical protein
MWRTVEQRSESAHAQLVQKLRDCEPAAAYAAAAGGADGGVETRCTDGSDEPWAVQSFRHALFYFVWIIPNEV